MDPDAPCSERSLGATRAADLPGRMVNALDRAQRAPGPMTALPDADGRWLATVAASNAMRVARLSLIRSEGEA